MSQYYKSQYILIKFAKKCIQKITTDMDAVLNFLKINLWDYSQFETLWLGTIAWFPRSDTIWF
jgi:hypothetical protein